MITIRPGTERGYENYGWTDNHFTFSFAGYYDPEWMGYRSLRVVTENTIQGGGQFSTHPHRDMEILTYVVEGALRHEDSMGNSGVIRAGEFQRMSAGTGVRHSEGNASETEIERNIQIWIQPERLGERPGYEQRGFSDEERRSRLRLVVSPEGREGSLSIGQDADIYSGLLSAGEEVRHEPEEGRGAWLHVVTGAIELNGTPLLGGDGAAVEEEALEIRATEYSDVLLFDLAESRNLPSRR